MKKRTAISIAVLAALGLISAGVVSAHSGFWFGFGANPDPEEMATLAQQRFQTEADLLGTDIETVKNAWAEGKRLDELATSLGIDETTLQSKLQEQMKKQIKERIQSLVDQGVITQDQADKRIKYLEDNAGTVPCFGQGKGWGHRGDGFGLGL